MKIVLASSNKGKIEEIQALLKDLPIELIPQSEFNIPDIEETGLTFVENAILKARHAAKISGLPALSDDSGLCVDSLYGAPGIYSARYAGKNVSYAERIQKLLAEMEDEEMERDASFHCVIALMEHEKDPTPLICHGIWEGEILLEPKGDKGFGYDPIFYDPMVQLSAGEMVLKEKNKISHRGQALLQLQEILKGIL